MDFTRSIVTASVILTSVLTHVASAYEGAFRAGDRIATVDETPVMSGAQTLTTVPAGTRLVATDVQNDWVAVTVDRQGLEINGWINQEYLEADTGNLQVIFSDQDSLTHGQAVQYRLPVGKPVVISLTSQRPVDVFVVSDEGLANFKWVMKNGNGQMQSFRRRLSVRSTQFEWTPPNEQQFRLLVDNTAFPDAGARPFGETQIAVRYFRPVLQLDEPVPGLGLVLGRVALEYDGYEGRRGACTEPLTVHLAHKTAEQEDEDAQIIEVAVDTDGWFAVGNLIPERHYWVKAVKGLTFTVKPSFRISGPIRSKDAKDGQLVRDVGFFEFRVNADGGVSTKLTGPDFQIANRQDKKGNSVHFGSAGPLSRHDWFESEHADSGWLVHVRADRQRLDEARRKKQSDMAPAVPADSPNPEAAPAPPVDDVAPAPAPPTESPKDGHSVALR